MKQIIITAITLLSSFVGLAQTSQPKTDTAISKKDITTLQRNLMLIQNSIHALHIDGLLRDKLDSVYTQSYYILAPPKKDVRKP